MILEQTVKPNLSSRKPRAKGFTLIELLIVIGILGGVLGASLTIYARESRVTAVRQVATQLQADFEELRSKTIRYNDDSSFNLNSASKYTLTIADGGTPVVKIRDLPSNITITVTSGSPSSFSYRAPFSQVSAASRGYEIKLDDIILFVKVIGVTGRAVQSATD